MRSVDAYGRVTVDADELIDLLYVGGKIDDVLVNPGPAIDQFNAMAQRFDLAQYRLLTPMPLDHSPEDEHAKRRATWFLIGDLADLDVREFVLSLCTCDAERARVHEEMDLFEERHLLPLLKTVLYVVDHLRRNHVVWGVGRGSSVASFVLFKIGIHKINPLKFGLSIREFLRD